MRSLLVKMAALAVAILAATLPYGSPSSAQIAGNILTVAYQSYPPFDPATEVRTSSYMIFVNVYEGLLAYGPGTLRLVPALATSWSASPDLTVYTFRIRPGVRFHDGTLLDAEAVKLSIDRVKKLGLGPSIYVSRVKEVVVVDPMTVRIVLNQASSTFPANLPKVYIHGKAHASDPNDGREWFANNVNGTGPFKVARAERDQFILLQRYAEYWKGWPDRSLAGILLRLIPDPSTQKLMLQRGEVDMITWYAFAPDEPPDNLERFRGIKIVNGPIFRTFVYSMNVQKQNSPLRDKRVRKAIALAFDYEAMPAVFFGKAVVPNGYLPPGFIAYDSSRPKFKRDLAAARRLLADAGFAQGFEIDAMVNEPEEAGKKLGLILQASLKELGIKVNIVSMPPFAILTARIANLETAPPMGLHRTMQPFTADPGAFIRSAFGAALAGKPYNDSWYQNPQVERLLDDAERTSDESRRIALWRQAETIILDDQPAIFAAFATPQFIPVRDRVENFVPPPTEPSGAYPFYGVFLR